MVCSLLSKWLNLFGQRDKNDTRGNFLQFIKAIQQKAHTTKRKKL